MKPHVSLPFPELFRVFRGVGAAGVLVALAACAVDESTAPTDLTAPVALNPTDGAGEVILCKYTPEPTLADFEFTVSATAGQVPGNGHFTLTAVNEIGVTDACAVVWTWSGQDAEVTIQEEEALGWELYLIADSEFGWIDPPVNPYTFTATTGQRVIYFKNRDVPVDMAPGRMTGGGGQIIVGDVRVTRGFTIHCDIVLSNNVEINWDGNRWHLDKPLTAATCVDDPAVEPAPPPAPFDTFIGEGYGRLNNVDGSFLRFTFVDSGEPGGKADRAAISIWAPGADPATDAPILLVDGVLDHGNLQAHYDQPHKQ